MKYLFVVTFHLLITDIKKKIIGYNLTRYFICLIVNCCML